jgi:uncharacterized ubiquitin-like protein YukD
MHGILTFSILKKKLRSGSEEKDLEHFTAWKFEMKARDYMTLYNLIQNVDEDKKDPFEKVESSRKLVKKKRTHRTVICEDKF